MGEGKGSPRRVLGVVGEDAELREEVLESVLWEELTKGMVLGVETDKAVSEE